jgi:hypothetical protein
VSFSSELAPQRADGGLDDVAAFVVGLPDRDANTYGGVYLFSDAHAQAAFAGSDLFAAVAHNPNLTAVRSRAFDVLTGPTAVTRGELLAAERASV